MTMKESTRFSELYGSRTLRVTKRLRKPSAHPHAAASASSTSGAERVAASAPPVVAESAAANEPIAEEAEVFLAVVDPDEANDDGGTMVGI